MTVEISQALIERRLIAYSGILTLVSQDIAAGTASVATLDRKGAATCKSPPLLFGFPHGPDGYAASETGSDWHREAAVGVGALGLGCWCLLDMPYTLLGGIMLRRTLIAAAATLPLIISTAAFRSG